jgi:hypothetical protein
MMHDVEPATRPRLRSSSHLSTQPSYSRRARHGLLHATRSHRRSRCATRSSARAPCARAADFCHPVSIPAPLLARSLTSRPPQILSAAREHDARQRPRGALRPHALSCHALTPATDAREGEAQEPEGRERRAERADGQGARLEPAPREQDRGRGQGASVLPAAADAALMLLVVQADKEEGSPEELQKETAAKAQTEDR